MSMEIQKSLRTQKNGLYDHFYIFCARDYVCMTKWDNILLISILMAVKDLKQKILSPMILLTQLRLLQKQGIHLPVFMIQQEKHII